MKDAIGHMVEAIRINPLYWKGYLILGEFYKSTGYGDPVEEAR